ncbi:cold-shock protein [Idiomarina sp. ST10R2A5]|uniref:cold-shock protein n=1 Tax=Idiomarina sp. ST10R2A5 TaxID=3418368 RepID=UPI003EC7454E
MSRKEGVVKSLKPVSGYGFIETGFGADVFFHETSIGKTQFNSLKIGQPLRFEIKVTYKGLEAVNIELLKESSTLRLYKKEYGLFESNKKDIENKVVFTRLPVVSQWFKTIEEAESDVRQFALKLGANALLSKQQQKDKRKSDHNSYIYHVYRVSAEACLVAKKDFQGDFSKADLEAQASAMESTLEQFKSEYERQLGRSIYDSADMTSEKVSHSGGIIFGVIFFTIILIFISLGM